MLNRLRTMLVSSFIGAIALGWIFAQAIMHFVSIPLTPITRWVLHREYQGVFNNKTTPTPTDFVVYGAVPEALKSLALFAIGYFLLRWLYDKPFEVEASKEQ